MRLTLTPGAGSNSKVVMTGPGRTATTLPATPKSASLFSRMRELVSSAASSIGLCALLRRVEEARAAAADRCPRRTAPPGSRAARARFARLGLALRLADDRRRRRRASRRRLATLGSRRRWARSSGIGARGAPGAPGASGRLAPAALATPAQRADAPAHAGADAARMPSAPSALGDVERRDAGREHERHDQDDAEHEVGARGRPPARAAPCRGSRPASRRRAPTPCRPPIRPASAATPQTSSTAPPSRAPPRSSPLRRSSATATKPEVDGKRYAATPRARRAVSARRCPTGPPRFWRGRSGEYETAAPAPGRPRRRRP